MYLVYNGYGIFLGVITESLGYDIFKENSDYCFIEIPKSLDYDEETDEWKLPPASLRVFQLKEGIVMTKLETKYSEGE